MSYIAGHRAKIVITDPELSTRSKSTGLQLDRPILLTQPAGGLPEGSIAYAPFGFHGFGPTQATLLCHTGKRTAEITIGERAALLDSILDIAKDVSVQITASGLLFFSNGRCANEFDVLPRLVAAHLDRHMPAWLKPADYQSVIESFEKFNFRNAPWQIGGTANFRQDIYGWYAISPEALTSKVLPSCPTGVTEFMIGPSLTPRGESSWTLHRGGDTYAFAINTGELNPEVALTREGRILLKVAGSISLRVNCTSMNSSESRASSTVSAA